MTFLTRNHHRPSRPVLDALRSFPKGLCSACLIEVVGKTRDDALTPAQRLRNWNGAKYDSGFCERCLAQRNLHLLIKKHAVISSGNQSPSLKLRDFDMVWELVSGYLDRLDGGDSKLYFTDRIDHLTADRRISKTFAALLRTFGTYRHLRRYNSYQLSDDEQQILSLIGVCIESQLRPLTKRDAETLKPAHNDAVEGAAE
jgi:hypothetical protein